MRENRMITTLKGAKAVPTWMLHKAVGTLMQARIEYENEMASRGETEEDNQDFGEFVEDRYVELYGLKKIAESNLRDLLKGLKVGSQSHVRLQIFRAITALVPGDEDSSYSDAAAIFMRVVLRMLVEMLNVDHLSGLKGSAFWTHFARTDILRVPAHYLEKIAEKIANSIKYLKSDDPPPAAGAQPAGGGSGKPAKKQLVLTTKKEADAIRAIKCLEATLADHAEKNIPSDPIDPKFAPADQKTKTIEVGDDIAANKPTPKGSVGRVCIDSFLARALEHWTKLEDLEEELLLKAFGTWDLNGDGRLQLEEFTQMVTFANPTAHSRKITRAFVAACGGGSSGSDYVDRERLGPILLAYGFVLADRPADYNPEADYVPPAGAPEASGGDDGADDETPTDYRAMRMSMKQLSSTMKALKALGAMKDVSRVTEDEVVGVAVG